MQRLRRIAGQAGQTVQEAGGRFFPDNGPQFAAALSYYALFSLFPLAILTVAVFGLVVDDAVARRAVIDFVLENVPLREGQGRRELEEVLTSVTQSAQASGVVGLASLVFAASGVMGTLRAALNRAWSVQDTRPVVQGKLVDVLLVLGVGGLVLLSFGLTLVTRLTQRLGGELEEVLGEAGTALARVLLEVGQLLPAVVSFAVFALLLTFVPATRTRLRDVWPGALFAAVAFELTKTAFAVYLENFADYSAVYASLAAVVAFLVFVFVTANLFLFGAEIAVAWPRVRDGLVEEGPDEPFGQRLRRGAVALFVRRAPLEHEDDTAGRRSSSSATSRPAAR